MPRSSRSTAICGTLAWLLMRRTTYAGGDLIILTLALAVCLAIVVAGLNWAVAALATDRGCCRRWPSRSCS